MEVKLIMGVTYRVSQNHLRKPHFFWDTVYVIILFIVKVKTVKARKSDRLV